MEIVKNIATKIKYWVHHLLFFQLVLISRMVALSSCLIRQIISFILPPNEYGCVYSWTTLGNIPTLLWRFWQKKKMLSDEAHFDLGGYENKQNFRICGTKNSHAYIEKRKHPKRVAVWCGFLVQRHNWAIFLRKWARRGRYSQWRSLKGHVERIFVQKNLRRGYWQHLVSTRRRYVSHSRSYTRYFAPCFWRYDKINCQIWQLCVEVPIESFYFLENL